MESHRTSLLQQLGSIADHAPLAAGQDLSVARHHADTHRVMLHLATHGAWSCVCALDQLSFTKKRERIKDCVHIHKMGRVPLLRFSLGAESKKSEK
jgi:hypothetical protein